MLDIYWQSTWKLIWKRIDFLKKFGGKHMSNTMDLFRIDGKICIVTGGAGLFGDNYAAAVFFGGGNSIFFGIN